MQDRYGGAYGFHRHHFANNILVRCPRCHRQAFVCQREAERMARLSCAHCGYNRQTSSKKKFFVVGTIHMGALPEWSVQHFGGPYDPFFRQELWLCAPFEG
ncbi:hypothetical protein GCM10023184_19340 [Flaviaesturariibacter amylovorans]|uniref:Transposase zinc-ribbon domain-containing protein n=2 Tax=Flaviaesturariibacter amylovorans TaxID=1084520 RepID=A0ABP8GRX6_9BACT